MSRPLALGLIILVAASNSAAEPKSQKQIQIDWGKYDAVQDQKVGDAAAKFTVVCFLGTECPLTRLYGQRLSALNDEFGSRSVAFVGVNSNPQDSVSDIEQYIQEYAINFPIIKDTDQTIAELFQATRTPEVFVLNSKSNVEYHGRIDDQYEPGIFRPDPTKHDLHESLDALLAGKPVPKAETVAVGCLITKIEKSKADNPASVTFARDVAPILNRRCVECHRKGEIGPFALTDYEEVIGWGEMMLEVIDQGRMPPWHADPSHGKFVGERRMPAEEKKVLADWVKQGMPLGDPKEIPPQPHWVAGWHVSRPPDVEFVMRDKPFVVPADGTVDYQYFVIDPQWTEDRWVSAAQVIPGDASVVHHAIVFVRPPDGTDSHGIGWLGAYVPGQRSLELPPGHARRVPAGSRLVFQMHYTPNGKATADRSRVGVWFADAEGVTHEVFTRVALNHNFEIPPGAKDHRVKIRVEGFAEESRLLGIMPHMHVRGKSFLIDACREDRRETVLSVPRYDFNWQHWYALEKPLELSSIDAFEMEISYDNSSANPVNPDPNEYVTWGDQTWNEMAVAFLDISYPRDKPLVEAPRRRAKASQVASETVRMQQIEQKVQEFLKKMDRNADGIVVRDETPLTFQRFGFRRMDTNGDGELKRDEIEAAAAESL